MRKWLLLTLGMSTIHCGQDIAGGEFATLQVGIQGLYENTAEIDLKAGSTSITAMAKASATRIAVNVSVSQNGQLVTTIPLDLPNANPKIPEGESASASTTLTLAAGETRRVDLLLTFGPAAGTAPNAAMDFNITFGQDKPAPTIDYFFIYPGPSFAPKQTFKAEVFATNHVGATADLKVSATVKNSTGTVVDLILTNGRFTGTLTAPDVLGDYTLEVRVSDPRPASTVASKILYVVK